MNKKLSLVVKKLIYDELYDIADMKLRIHNPCNISLDGKTCTGGHPCCGGCEHLGPTGCTVKALMCKTWLCYEVKGIKAHDKVIASLATLAQTGTALGIPMGMRSSKEENFKGAK